MVNNTFNLKKYIGIIIFIFILILFIWLLIYTKDNKLIDSIKQFVKEDTKVLYISNEYNYSNYPITLFNKYEINYLYVKTDNLSKVDKRKLKNIINSEYLNNIVIIFKDGKVKDAIIDYKNEDKLNKFLESNDIIPSVMGKLDDIFDNANRYINSDYSLIYVPYEYINGINEQISILTDLKNKYRFDFNIVNAYLLSTEQKKKLNLLFKISDVKDQIILLVKEGKIVGSVRGINTKDEYKNKLAEYKFISSNNYNINEIDYNKFLKILSESNKNATLIVKDNCKYCDDVVEILKEISSEKNIMVNYINVENSDSNLALNISDKLKQIGYTGGISYPLTILSENNKILNFIIGASDKSYFLEIFKENGIIIEEVQ